MSNNPITGTYSTGITLTSGVFDNPVTVTSTANIYGNPDGISAATDWTIDNQGTIAGGGSGEGAAGVFLGDGGSVTNEIGGTISGGYGVLIRNTAGMVDNAGTITGSTYFGVYLVNGSVTNESGGSISGGFDGVIVAGGAGTVDNSGTITGGTYAGAYFINGGSVTNEGGGSISGAKYGVYFINAPGTVDNSGTITGEVNGVRILNATGTVDNSGAITGTSGAGIYLQDGGSVTNESGGSISGGPNGVYIHTSPGTVDNLGTITGASHNGVELEDGGSITNAANGSISGKYYGVIIAATGTVDNAGTITGRGSDGVYLADGSVTNAMGGSISAHIDGVLIANTAGTVDNFGTITGTYGEGVYLRAGGSITNEAGGSIIGGFNGVHVASGVGTVDNFGTIIGEGYTGIYSYEGASVTNESGGLISGANYGVTMFKSSGTVDNFGTIIGGSFNGDHFHYAGVRFYHGGSVTNEMGGSISGPVNGVRIVNGAGTVDNAGAITATSDAGVYLGDGGSITNRASGSIGGYSGIRVNGPSATVENAGTITGGTDSVYLDAGGANRLIVDAGAVFNGVVAANAGAANTIELTSGSSAGTISRLGTHYTGFQTVTIDSGATWTVGGTEAGFNSATIEGFGVHDTLDVTNLMFNGGDSVTLNGSDLLTIESSGGTPLETIQLAGSFTGDFFHLALDSGTGTLITENTTPCYCRGTRIRTQKGEVAVEDLKIGNHVMTAGGKLLPIKWIGRRSYRDWLAIGNEDVQPICFKAGSIADHVPARDLYVSPEHAMFLDGVLVPALHLVNGVSIVKMSGMEEIEYFHLEFDRHVVIYAEGAAAESFVDDDSRMLFHNAEEYRRLYPDEQRDRFTEFCAPRVETGAALDTLRRRLTACANGDPAIVQRGYLDRATRNMVEGWAFAGMGKEPVKLAVLVNGAVVGQAVADRYRAGLGFGDEHCSFRFDLPLGLSPDVAHRIEVRRESDWSPLIDGCVTLES